MSRIREKPGLFVFGSLINFNCHIRDLKLVLRRIEEIEFPEYEEALEEESLIGDVFPDISRKGFIVTLLIALDDEFKNLCGILCEVTDQKLKWNDLRGSALERFITYSEKVCGINDVYDNALKQDLIGLIEVRNCIVHNNSDLQGFSKRKLIENFSKRLDGLSIEDGFLTISCDACINAADLVFNFMEHAYQAAQEVYPYPQ